MADIQNLTEGWNDHSGKEVREFIQRTLRAHETALGLKIGGIAISREIDANNYYHLLGFETDEQAQTYRLDGTEDGKLFEIEIPISTVQADTYRAQLVTSRIGSSEANPFILQRGDNWLVPLRLNAWHVHASDNTRELLPATTTLIVERSQNGTDWTQVRTATITSTESESIYPLSLNIGPDLDFGTDAAMRVRFRILPFPYESGGEEQFLSASSIVIYVKTVTLSVSMPDAQWQQAKEVNSGVQNLNGLTFNLLGNVSKTLHLQITNASGTVTYDNTFSGITSIGEYNVNAVDNSGVMGLTTSGVHELTAWLTCSSIDGTTLTSERIKHQIIVVNKGSTAGALVRRVLLQRMAASVDNFVQGEVCRYMIWNPKVVDGNIVNDASENVQARFIVADTADLTENHSEYLSLPVSAVPGTAYSLTATMEVEDDSASDSYAAYLHASDMEGNSMLLEPKFLTIDNTAGFQPIGGSVFHLNPKTRDNDETTPQTIINTRDPSNSPGSTWVGFKMDASDGYTIDDSGEKVLRVPAGRLLTINYNPFNWFYTAPNVSKALTLDIDFCVRNVTNEDDPVIRLAEYQQSMGAWLGLMMKSMDGTMVGVTSGTNIQETDFRWAEGRRQHLSISIIPGVKPNEWDDLQYNTVRNTAAEAAGTIDLVRVCINGVIVRETRFTPGRAAEFCTGVLSNGGIVIGQTGTDGRSSGADVDIYGIRVWHTGLKPAQQLQNFVSTIPDSATKRRIKAQNDILKDDNSGRLSLGKARGIGKNVLVWHGDMPLIDSDSKKGWAEVSVYDTEGNYLPEYSGTFCKETKNLKAKGQGTTAMTYYYWNMQVKLSDVVDMIVVPISLLHESISHTWDGEYVWKDADNQPTGEVGAWKLKGGCLGKNFPLPTESAVAYHGTEDSVTVPDGWVDGNGYYRGMCWQNGPGHPLAQKLVLKVNYASSMQSHLIGVNWLYNELHTRYCGENSLQAGTPASQKAQVAKQVIPVLFFTAGKNVTDNQQTESTATYQGPGGFGPGKMDKPTWGYVKSAHPYFGMFEGAVNNSILSDMLAPWDDTDHVLANGTTQPAKVKYWLHDPVNSANKDPESFYYRRTKLVTVDVTDELGNVIGQETVEQNDWEKGIGFDAGKTGRSVTENPTTDEQRFNNLLANSNSCDVPDEAPAVNITGVIRDAWNYLYLHNPNINLYRGTFDEFRQRTFTETELKQKWVCRSNGNDVNNYKLKRYDFCERQWVDAGLWNTTSHAYDEIDIRYYAGMNWSGMSAAEQNDHAAVVAKFKRLLIAEAYPTEQNQGIGQYFKVSSLRFHYAFINLFIAGTDNCSKNTYYVIDPETHKIELHQDDVDTVMATDNYGYQTKPYYIDRKHPYPDGSSISGYDGMNNGLFDLTEALWLDDDNHTISQTLGEVINLMAQLTGGLPHAESDNMGGVWKTLNRYLFNIQRWIPQVAYNEAARIRYEFPAMLGYSGRDGQARPLAQSMGDQLEAEIQFMRQRLVYMASYAGCCEFSPSIGAGRQTTGIDDLGTIFSIPVTALPNGAVPTYTFRLVPHQYIYPCFYQEGNPKQTFHRTAPGEEYEYTVPNLSVNDYAVVLAGLNYFRSIGNVGDMSTPDNRSMDLTGTRLTSFVAEPTTYYPTAGGSAITKVAYDALSAADKEGYQPAFRPTSVGLPLNFAATRLHTLSLNGCKTISASEAIPLDLSRMTLAQTIDLQGTAIQAVTVPQTATLQTLRLPAVLKTLTLENMPALTTVEMEGVNSLENLTIGDNVPMNSGSLVRSIFNSAGKKLKHLYVRGASWTNVAAAMVTWMMSLQSCSLTGSITLPETEDLPYRDVIKLIDRFGDIQSPSNSLYVYYHKNTINQFTVKGVKYIKDVGNFNGWEISVLPTKGNNVAIVNGHEDITWSLSGEDVGDYMEVVDAVKGVVRVKQTQVTEHPLRFTLTVSMNLTDGSSLSYTKTVGVANRIPRVGDFAYADGTFDDEYDTSKKLVGVVVKRDVLEWLDEESGVPRRCKCWVYAKENVRLETTDGTYLTSTPPWGIYPDSGSSGIESGVRNEIAAVSNMPASGDTLMTNIGSTGMSTSYIPTGGFRDDNENDGFKKYAATVAVGDFDTENKNEIVLNHAKSIIVNYLAENYESVDRLPTSMTELADTMQALVAELTAGGTTSPGRFRQLFFPAAYSCHLYEPTLDEGDVLDEQYTKNHWMLPAAGLLSRIYNFFYQSCGQKTYEAGGRCTRDNADETITTEALIPLFANVLQRIYDAGITGTPFAIPSNSYFWSVTEYNSNGAWYVSFGSGIVGNYYGGKYNTTYVVRPVAAFTFTL